MLSASGFPLLLVLVLLLLLSTAVEKTQGQGLFPLVTDTVPVFSVACFPEPVSDMR